MSDNSVRDEVRQAWLKKQEASNKRKRESESESEADHEDNVISLLSDDDEVVEVKRTTTIREPTRTEVIAEPKLNQNLQNLAPFKPLHNPTYDVSKLSNSMTMNDLLGSPDLSKSYLFSFQYSLPFILQTVKSKHTPITLVYQRGTVQDYLWKTDYNLNLIEVEMKPFSSHHPKLIINFYDNDTYLKVFMISANLTELEFALNNQIVWESPKLHLNANSISTPFKEKMLDWIKSYGKPQLNNQLVSQLEQYDFSGIIGDFVSSSAGSYHSKFGFYSLYDALKEKKLLPQDYSTKTQLLYQSSSVGAAFSHTKEGAANTFSHLLFPLCMGKSFPIPNGPESLRNLQRETNTELFVIFPSLNDVKSSMFGFDSGGWSHYNPYSKNGSIQHKTILSTILHKSYSNQRKTNSSHTKFLILSKDGFKTLEWVLFTSANLSQSAWGKPKFKKKHSVEQENINISNYETGILISRNHYPKSANIKLVPVAIGEKKLLRDNEIPIELPFNLPPEKYATNDEPWCLTKDYKEPDSRGVRQMYE
jgi:tyrosyl-DNA phosphodiesterase-1